MIRLLALAAATGIGACGGSVSDPVWAVDQITVDPGEDQPSVLQAWTLHDTRWEARPRPASLVCALLVELDGAVEDDTCDACDVAFRVDGVRVIEDPCPEGTLDAFPLLTATAGFGFGTLSDELAADTPVDGAIGGFVHLGDRWIPHGWAFPVGAEDGTASTGAWDGVRPFAMRAAWAWDLTTTPHNTRDRDTDAADADALSSP